MTRRILSVVAAILVCSTSVSAQKPKEISLISWTLFRPAIDKLIPQFESKTGYKVNLTWAPGPDSKERVALETSLTSRSWPGPSATCSPPVRL